MVVYTQILPDQKSHYGAVVNALKRMSCRKALCSSLVVGVLFLHFRIVNYISNFSKFRKVDSKYGSLIQGSLMYISSSCFHRVTVLAELAANHGGRGSE